jgi:hypothetical protein
VAARAAHIGIPSSSIHTAGLALAGFFLPSCVAGSFGYDIRAACLWEVTSPHSFYKGERSRNS